MNIRNSVVSKVSSFPTLPTVSQKLLALIDDSGTDVSEIGKIIQYDPALTANVLKAANSGYLGFTKPVNSVAEASAAIMGDEIIMKKKARDGMTLAISRRIENG